MTKGIYCYYDNLRCKIIYVGKDSYIDKNTRHGQHYQPSKRDEQKINEVLQNDNKSGRYSYAVLEQGDFTRDELNQKEISWIKFFNPRFNFTEGGDGASSGEKHPMYGKPGYWKDKKLSKEHREKLSRSKSGENHPFYGIKRPKETCEKISKARTGTKHTKETCEKIRKNHADFSGEKNPMYNKHHTEESREKMSEALSGEKHPRFNPCIKIKKQKQKNCKQGFYWVSFPYTPEKQIYLSSVDLQKCIKKVQEFIDSERNVYGYTSYKIIK